MEKVEVNSERWLSLEDLNGEIWKDTEYPFYQISNYGRLKRLAHMIIPRIHNKHSHPHWIKDKICKVNISRNYYNFRVSVNGVLTSVSIHRLVAKAFIPNPDNYEFVNHRNENKLDNRSVNLEWCTAKYNSNYASCQIRHANTVRTNSRAKIINICQYNRKGELIHIYLTRGELDDAGFQYKTVMRTCRGRQESASGYIWRFKGDAFSPITHKKFENTIDKTVLCCSKDGTILKEYTNIKEAVLELWPKENPTVLKQKRNSISSCCRRTNKRFRSFAGYLWYFKEDMDKIEKFVDYRERKVSQFSKTGEYITSFDSIKEAAIALGDVKKKTNIYMCCLGRRYKTAYGYIWKYKEE